MITLEITGHIARVRLDRPAARNALGAEHWRSLAGTAASVAASEARVLLLLSSAPGAFCAGSDLTELALLAEQPDARAAFRQMMRDGIDPLRALPIPTLAAIDGDCFGAGVALALGCDIRIAGEGARFGITPAKLGISYPKEDVDRLEAAVGRGQAARLLFSACTIDAAEALRIGLVEQLAPSAVAAAEAMAAAIADNAPSSVVRLKAALSDGPAAEPESFASSFDDAFASHPFQEGLAAFRARRRPAF